MAPNRHARTRGNDNRQQRGGTAPTPTTVEKAPWLAQELLKLTDMNYDLCGKIGRAVNADQSLLNDLLTAPDAQRRALMRQLKDRILGSTKSARDKAKDQSKATSRETKGGAKYTKLVGDDFTSAT